MISLNVKGDKKSPGIIFEPYSGLLVISGKSSLENPGKFFEPVLKWIEKYVKDAAIKTTFRMEMDYFNSSTAKYLMKIFRILEELNADAKNELIIEWCHDDLDHSMQESGEDYQSMLKLTFRFVKVE